MRRNGSLVILSRIEISKAAEQVEDIIEIIGQAIIGIARPYYIKENNLKDFDYNKGPVFKETLDQSPKK